MRLGGPILQKSLAPDAWVQALQQRGYRAAYCPLSEPDAALSADYARAAQQADIVIAEVGAWSNSISPDESTRRAAIALNQSRLALADAIGARCCVDYAGSRHPTDMAPHPSNLTDDTFDLIVQTTREIIDAVKPKRAFYTLEVMQWVFPDTVDNYLKLIHAIDRPQFAAHLDPVNFITSPRLYYQNGALIRDAFRQLGPYIKSCHAKGLLFVREMGLHMYEVRPGLGALDYPTFLAELSKLDADMPLMMEHLDNDEDYAAAAQFIRSVR